VYDSSGKPARRLSVGLSRPEVNMLRDLLASQRAHLAEITDVAGRVRM
jgi:hypothetical protein